MSIALTTVIVLGSTGVIAALVLYMVAKRFHVYENPQIAEIEEMLPGANCGSCGLSGCHAFAAACASATSMEGLVCPGAGPAVMARIASMRGLAPVATAQKVAVVRCDGSCSHRPHTNTYDGVRSCAIEASLYGGETSCVYGCLGCGDCVAACPFDAMHIDPDTSLPVVDLERCVGCGRCAAACPKGIIELCEFHPDRALVSVTCMNHDKGALAMKECDVACIGCGLCRRACPSGAIEVKDFLAHIDPSACISCGACVEACPRKSIHYSGELVSPLTEENPTERK